VRAFYDVDVPASDWSEFGLGGCAAAFEGVSWVSPPADQPVAIGAALAWATRHDADRLHLFVEAGGVAAADTGAVARRAALFEHPVAVFVVDGNDVSFAEPSPPEPVPVPAPSTAEQRLLLEQAGLEVVVEDGDVVGEILGLEVARVVVDADGGSRLEVGVGRFDREAFALLHGELSPPEALARAVEEVSAVRRPDVEPHPINRVARERWLRRHLIEHPELVGAASLEPADATRPRVGLRDATVAIAVGERSDGTPVVVATSVGVDLEAVPDAADARLRHAPDADLVVVVPARDDHPVTRDLAAMLARPATVTAVDGPWPP
jgi:hypothetical protein